LTVSPYTIKPHIIIPY